MPPMQFSWSRKVMPLSRTTRNDDDVLSRVLRSSVQQPEAARSALRSVCERCVWSLCTRHAGSYSTQSVGERTARSVGRSSAQQELFVLLLGISEAPCFGFKQPPPSLCRSLTPSPRTGRPRTRRPGTGRRPRLLPGLVRSRGAGKGVRQLTKARPPLVPSRSGKRRRRQQLRRRRRRATAIFP